MSTKKRILCIIILLFFLFFTGIGMVSGYSEEDLGVWHFDDAAGEVAVDSTENDNDLDSTFSPSSWTIYGKYAGGWIASINKGFEKVSGFGFSGNKFSLGAWIKTDAICQDWGAFFDNVNRIAIAGMLNNGTIRLYLGGVQYTSDSGTFQFDENWHLVVAVIDDVSLKVYYDGEEVIDVYHSQSLPISLGDVIWGRPYPDGQVHYGICGFLDDAFFTEKSLTAVEVGELFESTGPYPGGECDSEHCSLCLSEFTCYVPCGPKRWYNGVCNDEDWTYCFYGDCLTNFENQNDCFQGGGVWYVRDAYPECPGCWESFCGYFPPATIPTLPLSGHTTSTLISVVDFQCDGGWLEEGICQVAQTSLNAALTLFQDLFIPNPQIFTLAVDEVKDFVLTRFPFNVVSDFVGFFTDIYDGLEEDSEPFVFVRDMAWFPGQEPAEMTLMDFGIWEDVNFDFAGQNWYFYDLVREFFTLLLWLSFGFYLYRFRTRLIK